jgi:hypothetical protein
MEIDDARSAISALNRIAVSRSMSGRFANLLPPGPWKNTGGNFIT